VRADARATRDRRDRRQADRDRRDRRRANRERRDRRRADRERRSPRFTRGSAPIAAVPPFARGASRGTRPDVI
jgi:hypothetical protein